MIPMVMIFLMAVGSQDIPYISSAKPALADKEIYLSGALREPIRWEVTKELRNLGYEVTTKRKKNTFTLKVRTSRIGDRIICSTTLYGQNGKVISQGRGESKYFYFRLSGRYGQMLRQKLRYKAESKAALESINALN